jgi:hypothetical protein
MSRTTMHVRRINPRRGKSLPIKVALLHRVCLAFEANVTPSRIDLVPVVHHFRIETTAV